MRSPPFLAELRVLHDKRRRRVLAASELPRYDELRTLLVRMVITGQSLGKAGPTLRSDLRVAKMLKVELRPDDGGGKALRLTTIAFDGLLPTAVDTLDTYLLDAVLERLQP